MVNVDSVAPLAVFAGSVTLDAIALVPSLPGRDERTVASDLVLAGGGPAATAAVTYARLGLRAALVGAIGDDSTGEQVRAELEREGVDTSGLQVVRGGVTGASVITVEQAHGTRTICTRPVPPLHVPADSVGAELLRAARWVHVDHLGWPALGGVTLDPEVRLSLDAGNPVAALDLSRLHLYVPTVDGLRRDLGAAEGTDVQDLLRAALDNGATTVVATRGAEGSVAASADGTSADTPGHGVDVVSTLGAGDVFHGALLAAVVRGMPLQRACAYAGVVAALSCRGLDGRSAIPDHDTASSVVDMATGEDRTTGTANTPGPALADATPTPGSRP